MRVKFGDILNLRHVGSPSTAALAIAGLALGAAEDLKMTYDETRTSIKKRLAARALARTTVRQVQPVQLGVVEAAPVDVTDYPLAA